jgi:sec-independent protein translocase protein TatA
MIRNALEPWHLLVLAIAAIALFGSKKLPDTARALGKSMRILKSEAKAMKNESGTDQSPPVRPASGETYGAAPRETYRTASDEAYGSASGGTYRPAPGEVYRPAPGEAYRAASGETYRPTDPRDVGSVPGQPLPPHATGEAGRPR